MTTTTYRLTRQRIERAAAYASEHAYHDNSGNPFVPHTTGTPDAVADTLTRIYGTPSTDYMGETTYWRVDDGGARLGLTLANLHADDED